MSHPELNWKDFDPETLSEARETGRPVLLLLTVPWCSHCRDLLDSTFRDPEVVGLVSDSFVPVRADAERRPDVNERFGSGGWPTIAFLTPTGELITHAPYRTAEQLTPLMRRVLDLCSSHGNEIDANAAEMWRSGERELADEGPEQISMAIVEDVVDSIYDKFDLRFGGWGQGAKFPHSEAIDFALVQVAKRGDSRMREVVTITLDRMMDGGIHDPIDGGFFRYSQTQDWRNPNLEKVLDGNVQRMRCYLEAYQLFGREEYRETAEGVVRWMLEFMQDPELGTFYGSLDADSAYYVLDSEGRRAAPPPNADRTVYTHANAMAVSNLLKASVTLDRADLRDHAMRALSFLLENLTDRNGEVYHYWDGTYHLPGRLPDQAHLVRALIDASQLTGDADLLLPAEKIAENVIQRQRAPGGGFYDILQDQNYHGSMLRRNRSILENSIMAEALVRLSYLSRRPEFYDEALQTLEAFTGDYKKYGYYVAGYGRAVDLIFYEPLFITIVGKHDHEDTDTLPRTPLSGYVPSRILHMLDPEHDPILIGRSGYQVESRAKAYLCVGRTTKAAVYDPDQLLQHIAAIESERRGR